MTDAATPQKSPPPSFGADIHARVLADLVLDSFRREEAKPLVAAIFGEWGSGKTFLLECVRDEVLRRMSPDGRQLAVPIWFNPWRHEAEAHVVIPFLKSAQHELLKQARAMASRTAPAPAPDLESQSLFAKIRRIWGDAPAPATAAGLLRQTAGGAPEPRLETAAEWLAAKAGILGDTAIALAAGLSGKFSLLGQEVQFGVDKILAEDRRRAEARSKADANAPDPLARYESIYFDLIRYLEQVTRRQEDGRKLNLVFVVDDLDRCMPEKAVQVLESIKLFLDVPGCAFVLALDEEVVDRGVEHHYQAYRDALPTEADALAYAMNPENFEAFEKRRATRDRSPITGAEYLEKLIQLPFHLPVLRRDEVEAFLVEKFPDLFKAEPGATGSQPGTAASDPLRPPPDSRGQLLGLFLDAVPYVPRKLIRAANLLRMARDVLVSRGFREPHMLTLARVVLLQLFAPRLYRLGRRNPAFFEKLEQWARLTPEGLAALKAAQAAQPVAAHPWPAGTTWDNDDFLDEILDTDTQTRWYIELGERLKECLAVRGRFDVRRMISTRPELASKAPLTPYLTLQPEPAAPPPMAAEAADLPETGRVANISQFIAQIFSGDPVQVSNALQQEAPSLAGRALAAEQFGELLAFLRGSPAAMDRIDTAWLEAVAPRLSQGQYRRLLQETRLIDRLVARIPAEAAA